MRLLTRTSLIIILRAADTDTSSFTAISSWRQAGLLPDYFEAHQRACDYTGRLIRNMRRLLIFQIIMVGMMTAALAGLDGFLAAKSSLFGGIIVLMNTGLMMLHEKRAAIQAQDDAQRILKHVYLCAVERLVLTLVLFAIGLVGLKLMPLQLLLGFIAGQLAAFLNGLSH